MARNSENPTDPPPSLQDYFCQRKKQKYRSPLPVKELKSSPVECVWFAKMRFKGDKLVEGDELGSIFALVKDSTEESKRLLVVFFLW